MITPWIVVEPVRRLLSPIPAAAAQLVGTRATRGFRRLLAALGESPASLDLALLDELPTLSIVSNYARVIESARPTAPRIPPLLNACAGWAEGGTADRQLGRVQPEQPPELAPAQRVGVRGRVVRAHGGNLAHADGPCKRGFMGRVCCKVGECVSKWRSS